MEQYPCSALNFIAACAPSGLETTPPRAHRRKGNVRFAAKTAKRIRQSASCRFSALDPYTLAHHATAWYEGCTEAMFDGHHTSLRRWLAELSGLAAENGYELEDVLQVLRVCRSAAIEMDRWTEEVVSVLDEVINEILRSLADLTWVIPTDLQYEGASPERSLASPVLSAAPRQKHANPPALAAAPEQPVEQYVQQRLERRNIARMRLELPVRIVEVFGGHQEVTSTRNVSKAGLNFTTKRRYSAQSMVKVIYPYWEGNAAANSEVPAEVLRLDLGPDGSRSVAIRFLKPVAPMAKAK